MQHRQTSWSLSEYKALCYAVVASKGHDCKPASHLITTAVLKYRLYQNRYKRTEPFSYGMIQS